MTVTESVYTVFLTDNGAIRLVHDITLGEALIVIGIVALLLYQIIKGFISKLWG